MSLPVFNIRHFAALAATVRHGSLTRAARDVHLTQPALTQAIAGLERDLDCTLFDRKPDGMEPTEAALLLAPRAEAAIRLIGSARVTGTQLRAFLHLARYGSYASASHASGISSASLHRTIADLSLALGQTLVERRGRGIVLTNAGQRRYRGFGLAMAELRAGVEDVARWKGLAEGRIVVGAMPLSRARWLPATIAGYTADNPGIDIVVIEGSFAELCGPLRDGDIDLMLGALREETGLEDLEQEASFEDRPAIIMRSDHPLATPQSALNPEQLTTFSWILPGRATPLRTYWEGMFDELGCEPPEVKIECGSVLTIRELLLAGDGLTLLSPEQLRVEIEAGILVALPPPAIVTRTIGITTRRGWHPTRSQRDFVDELRRNADR